jgi:probable rRNA maturation factor
MEVDVQALCAGSPPAPRVRWLLSRIARQTRVRAREVSVLFCGDRRMRSLNRRYRGKDRATDVLSFPAGPGGEAGLLGDIVISVPYARRQARRESVSSGGEMDRLLLHGFLHLLGYDHESDNGEMDALEARLRRRLRLAAAGHDEGRAT